MAERTVSVKLIADARAYIQGMDEVSRKTKDTTQTIEQQLGDQQRAFEQVGVAAVAVGTAIVGIGVAALNTGINYNTLQQTSRAALETLLGSAEAANAQMDKLDEFARTSPFAKQVFIEAQQQLLGFGTEAERVVPILDAIQNAVAATGGSNEDIAELTRIIAQLEGGVKLSAETLNQFGTRGIDAAALIGDAMGKTGEQIRSEITAGTLDASDAIVALTDGMQERFGGAAENVKDTFDGAVDRVKAAWRDLSAELAEPLVDPDGGGLLIDFFNTLADVMREFEDMPDPLRNTIVGLGGLTGVLALAGGAALLAVPKIADFRVALQVLGITAGTTSTALSGVAAVLTNPVVLGAAAALGGLVLLGQYLESTRPTVDEWTAAMERGANASELLALSNQGLLNSIDGFEFDTANVGNYLDQLDRIESSGGWASLLPENYDVQFTDFAHRLENINDALSQMEPAQAREAWDTLTEGLGLTTAEAEQMLGRMPDLARVLEDTEPAADVAADGIASVGAELQSAGEAAFEMLEASQALVDGFFRMQDTMSAYEQTVDDIAEALTDGLNPALEEGAGAFDLGEESGREAASMLAGLVASAQDATTAMMENGESAEAMSSYQAAARDEIYRVAREMGLSTEAALEYTHRLLEIPNDVVTDVQANFSSANASIHTWLAQRRVVVVDVVTGAGMPSIAPGGPNVAYAGGGRIPGYAPGYDDRLGFMRDGSVVGLGGGEYIMPTLMTDRYLPMLEQMRAGTFPGYAGGGRISNSAMTNHSTVYGGNTYEVYATTNVTVDGNADANAIAQIASNRAVAKIGSLLGGS